LRPATAIRAGRQAGAPVATGSHVDTQPHGGKFDGIFGVLAGLALGGQLIREESQDRDDAPVRRSRPRLVVAVAPGESLADGPDGIRVAFGQAHQRSEQLKPAAPAEAVLAADLEAEPEGQRAQPGICREQCRRGGHPLRQQQDLGPARAGGLIVEHGLGRVGLAGPGDQGLVGLTAHLTHTCV